VTIRADTVSAALQPSDTFPVGRLGSGRSNYRPDRSRHLQQAPRASLDGLRMVAGLLARRLPLDKPVRQDPLYRIRKLLVSAQEQLTQQGEVRLRAGLAAGDPTVEVAAAWQARATAGRLCRGRHGGGPRNALERFTAGQTASKLQSWPGLPGPSSLEGRDPRLQRHRWLLQRAPPRPRTCDQEGQAGRARFPRPQQLPAAVATVLWRHLADFPRPRDCLVAHHVWWVKPPFRGQR
jgi:hypothetical protein